MMFRNASQAFLALLLVIDLKPPHLVIALRNDNSTPQWHARTDPPMTKLVLITAMATRAHYRKIQRQG
jgi:hypothetical protein